MESMVKTRIAFILLGLCFIGLTHVGETTYRDWSYGNNISDFGLANYITSITGTIAAIFLLLGMSKESIAKYPQSALGVIVGCGLYEIFQPVLGTGVFDWQDLAAVIVTGSGFYIVMYLWFKPLRSKAT